MATSHSKYPATILMATSENPRFAPFEITLDMDFEVLGRVLTAWRNKQILMRNGTPIRRKGDCMWKIKITAIAVLLAGCASAPAPNETIATIRSTPMGARVTYGGNSSIEPVTLHYIIKPGDNGLSTPITVTWPSGASVTKPLKLAAGQELTYFIERPVADGFDIDAQWAIQVMQIRQQQDIDTQKALNDAAYSLGQTLGTALFRH